MDKPNEFFYISLELKENRYRKRFVNFFKPKLEPVYEDEKEEPISRFDWIRKLCCMR